MSDEQSRQEIRGNYNAQVQGDNSSATVNVRQYAPQPTAAEPPPPPAKFVGRRAHLDELKRKLESDGVTMLTALQGMGGIGKTATALKLAQEVRDAFPGGIFWGSLDPGGLAPPILIAWARTCGSELLQDLDDHQLADHVRDLLAVRRTEQGRLLVLIDDVRDEWVDAAQLLKRAVPVGVPLLLTTRDEQLALAFEADLHRLDLLSPAEAHELLVAHAGEEAVAREPDAADRLLETVGYLPLAIKLAGSHVQRFARRPGFQLAAFEREVAVAADRKLELRGERGLAATFAITYEALPPELQQRFCQVCVFSLRTLTLDHVAAVAQTAADALTGPLDDLVSRAFLEWGDAPGTYVLHPMLRQYGYDQLGERGEQAVRTMHRRAAEYLNEKITDEKQGGTPEELLEEVDQWERAAAWETFARRASALVGSLDRLGYWGEIEERLLRAEAALEPGPEAAVTRLQLWNDRVTVVYKAARWDEAIALWEQALAAQRPAGDERGLAATYNNLGMVYADQGEWERAIEQYEQSVAAKERLGDVHGLAQTYGNLGNVYARKGEWERAIEQYKAAAASLERLGDVHGLAATYNNLGSVYADQGEWERAIEQYEAAAASFERLGDVHGLAQTYNNLGMVYARKGEWERAIEQYEQSVAAKERLGDVHGLAQTYGNLGNYYQAQGDAKQAAAYMARAYLIFAQLGAAETQQAAQLLVNILGSVEAANDYLAQLASEPPA